jgi:hypothetical protein
MQSVLLRLVDIALLAPVLQGKLILVIGRFAIK